MNNNLPEGFRIQFIHLHPFNSTDKDRDGKKFKTICHIKDQDNNIIVTEYAHCSDKDQPSRKIGRLISQGRAIKKFNELLEERKLIYRVV